MHTHFMCFWQNNKAAAHCRVCTLWCMHASHALDKLEASAHCTLFISSMALHRSPHKILGCSTTCSEDCHDSEDRTLHVYDALMIIAHAYLIFLVRTCMHGPHFAKIINILANCPYLIGTVPILTQEKVGKRSNFTTCPYFCKYLSVV